MTDRMGERGRQGAAPLGGHTPGPWEASGYSDEGEMHVYGRSSGGARPYVAWVNSPNPNTIADARLIAAAPELLAALEATLPVLRGIGRGYSWADGEYTADEAVAVIAKARGEQ